MPTYDYECSDCGRRVTRIRPITERDDLETCSHCGQDWDSWSGPGQLVRVPSAPSFSIKGFNAANGYAKARQES